MLSMRVPCTFSFTHVNVWSCMSFLKGLLQAGAITVGREKRFCQARPDFRPCWSKGKSHANENAQGTDLQQVGVGYKRDLWLMLFFGEGGPGSADISTHLQMCWAIL